MRTLRVALLTTFLSLGMAVLGVYLAAGQGHVLGLEIDKLAASTDPPSEALK
jgi:hypothetical protein